MAMKRIMFSAGGSLGTPSMHQKNFSLSNVQMKVKDNRKSLKMRFRTMIRDYTNMFKKSHDEALEKTFKQDLMIILQEAFANVMDGQGTLNMNLGLTMLVPGARKINNKLNLLLKKINKFFKKQGYLSPMLQKQFYKMIPELIQAIADKVGSGEVNEEELNKDTDETEESQNEPRMVAASSSKRISMSGSEETIEQLMNQIDLDEYPVEEVTPDTIVFASDKIPDIFKSMKFTGMKYRSRCFNSEMANITFVMAKLDGDDYQSLFEKAIRMLKLRGIISIKVDPNNLDYSANDLEDGNVKYTVSLMASNLSLKPEDEQIGVYPGKDLPEGWVILTEDTQEPYAELTSMIDAGLTTSTLMKIESYLNGKDPSEKESIKSALIAKYGNNPIANLL